VNGAGTSFHGLHVLADDDPRWSLGPVAQAAAACAAGAHVVQLRAKHATDRQTLAWGREIRKLTSAVGATFVVNDRFDLALACDADAVHLGQDDLLPAAVPAAVRARLRIGRSTHDVAQAQQARAERVDYVAFGPVFGTTSKESAYDARGLPMLGEIARIVAPLPVVAIGGIDASRIPRLLEVGATGAAVISAVAAAPDPEAATRELVAAFGGSPS
jgi:thiamine-phosphate pyrophosphorylase